MNDKIPRWQTNTPRRFDRESIASIMVEKFKHVISENAVSSAFALLAQDIDDNAYANNMIEIDIVHTLINSRLRQLGLPQLDATYE